jgi:hypothetical protein
MLQPDTQSQIGMTFLQWRRIWKIVFVNIDITVTIWNWIPEYRNRLGSLEKFGITV